MDPVITASIIQGASAILATVIAAIAAALIGKKFSDTNKLKRKLKTARDDVAFLLAVEKEHCAVHKAILEKSNKKTIRDNVRESYGLEWSGLNTPGRVKNDE